MAKSNGRGKKQVTQQSGKARPAKSKPATGNKRTAAVKAKAKLAQKRINTKIRQSAAGSNGSKSQGKREKMAGKKRHIEQYKHADKERVNNPPVGLVTPENDPSAAPKQKYQYDPHLDPQLIWAGKAEHTSFEVPTVSLHVHERIDPRSIVEAVRKRNGDGNGHREVQGLLFEQPKENPPLREAIEFYKHPHGWTNRLIAGDSLLVMNSLLQKEGMAGKVQMVYIDPPYGIKYGSNFQPFVNKREVKDGQDADLTQEPEMIRAFRDTWELGIHSYLTYLRDRLLLARDLLHESGSCFVQISDDNLHHVREVMDEVFGSDQFCAMISYKKTGAFGSALLLQRNFDFIIWYARDKMKAKFRKLFQSRERNSDELRFLEGVEEANGSRRDLRTEDRQNPNLIPVDAKLFGKHPLNSEGYIESLSYPVTFEEHIFRPPPNRHWTTTEEGMQRLLQAHRLIRKGNTLRCVRYLEDYPASEIGTNWTDTGTGGFVGDAKIYVVQSDSRAISRCLLMTTDPGDIVLDPTCGSGTTASVAEQWGRRWIVCDTSRVAIALAKQRLMTSAYDFYALAQPHEGIGSGFVYRTIPHVTIKSIANNPEIREGMTKVEIERAIAKYADQETLYDQPKVDASKARVTGPFTLEAVPAPSVRPVSEVEIEEPPPADQSVGRSGPTLRQDEWRGELLKAGIRGKGGKNVRFSRVEPLAGTRWLHADAETDDDVRHRVVVSFGPEHAPLEQRQVAQALEEAQTLVPRPKVVVFASFHFDPEAAKDIDETNWPGVTLLKVQMNTDLLTDDLKKKRASNESFWMIGQPDVVVNSEQWIVNSRKEALAGYGILAKLSGVDRLAEINGLGRDDLSLFVAIAQRRDLWAALATDSGGGVDTGQHSRRSGPARDGGVSPVSGHRPGLPGRIGDAGQFVRELELLSPRDRDQRIKRLRGSREIIDRAGQIAPSLTFPLSTIHYSQVTIQGFDYYNPVTGTIESGDTAKIAMWMLDTDYDGRSLYPRQVFFPMAGEKDGWAKLAKSLKAEIDEDLIETYRGTVSLPFERGDNKRIAVKIVDDRGIESLRIVELQ